MARTTAKANGRHAPTPLHDVAAYDVSMHMKGPVTASQTPAAPPVAPAPMPMYAAPAPTVLTQNTNFMMPIAALFAAVLTIAGVAVTTTWQVGAFVRGVEKGFEQVAGRMEKLETAVNNRVDKMERRAEDYQAATLDKLGTMTGTLQNAYSANMATQESVRDIKLDRVTRHDIEAWCRVLAEQNPKLSVKCPSVPTLMR